MAAFPPGRSFVRAAAEAVSKAGWHPVEMGQFAAREDPPADYCERQVRACDVYLAVVGFRYGSLAAGRADGVSYTELEFLAAAEVGLTTALAGAGGYRFSTDRALPDTR